MNRRLDDATLSQIVTGPPMKTFISNDGERVQEPLVLIAWVDSPEEQRQYLSDHGVDLTYAHFDPDTLRWECCLMSEGVAELLEDLYEEDDFPYLFEAGPSQGELEWLEAQARGDTERPELPLSAYLQPADPQRLARVTSSLENARPGSNT